MPSYQFLNRHRHMEQASPEEVAALAFYRNLFRANSTAPQPADLQESLARLEACAAHNPYHSLLVHERIAILLNLLGRRRDAIAAYEKLEQKCGDTALEAWACIEQGLLLEEIDEEASRCTLLRGVALAQQSGRTENEDYWSTRVRSGRFVLGKLLCYATDYENALRYLQDLDYPPAVHYFLGLAQAKVARNLSSGQKQGFEKALHHCQTYVGLHHESPAYLLMGNIYLQLENYENARRMFAEAASLAPQEQRFASESEYWWICGTIETNNLGRHQEATVSFTSSLEAALKVEDVTVQGRLLLNAMTWLEKAFSLVQGINTDEWKPTNLDDELSQISFKIIRAEALMALGRARVQNGMFKEACQCFQDAVNLIENEQHSFCQEGFEMGLLYRSQWALAELACKSGEWEEALKLYTECKRIARSEKDKLRCDTNAAFALKLGSQILVAFEAFTKAMKEYCTLLDIEWVLKAQLLVGLGQTLAAMGNWVEAVSRLEAARKILEEKQAFDSDTLGLAYLAQFYAYIENEQVWDGFQLANSFRAIMNACPKASSHQQVWQYMSGVASSVVVNHEQAVKAFTNILETQSGLELESDWMLTCGTLQNLANAFRNQGDFDNALEKYEEARHVTPESDYLTIGHICINRAGVYIQMAQEARLNIVQEAERQAAWVDNNRKAFDEYDRAITILESICYRETSSLAKAYAGQAVALCHLNDLEAASKKLEKARKYAGSNRILIAKLKYIQAHVYCSGDAHAKAESENREAAILLATLQTELQDLASAWISLLGGEMKHVFIYMQFLLVKRAGHLKALLWAERGRMRLYFHLMGQLQKVNLQTQQDPLWFDKDDELAKECIHQAMNNCASGTAIVEYTYAEAEGCLYAYVVNQASDLSVDFQLVDLQDFFNNKTNSNMGQTVSGLIKRTRSEIKKRAEDKAKQGLSILYRLLVEPIWQYIAGCSTVIFAPHECLSLVPFAALYDSGRKEFLIEHKAVGIIPSIRALQQCFSQQSVFEEGMQAGTLDPPFVAGDPQPMGLGLRQLQGAAKEADDVAKKLGVESLVGSKMTKQAVIDGLCNACVVVLVTHGIVDPSFPHGALIMQGQGLGGREVDPASDTSLRSLAVRGMPGTREAIQAMSRASEVLTADEIGDLEGGIRAGLVVLSACQTGEGEISSEGSLGLGRAVLQAGASSVVLTLWEVDDDSTRDLVTGLFQHLVDSTQTIVAAMQLAMLQMLRSGSCIYNWAPLMAFGSPTVRLAR
eukprot:c9470_g1_i1 orf=50-3796(+)